MNNSAGIFQVDELLATKLRGSGVEDQIEVLPASKPSTRSGWCPIFGSAGRLPRELSAASACSGR